MTVGVGALYSWLPRALPGCACLAGVRGGKGLRMVLSYTTGCLLLAGVLAGLAVLVGLTRWQPGLWRVLPRERLAGEIMALVALVWSAHHVCLMLEGNLVRWHPLVKALVPLTAVLAWFFLDYLFTRAVGGLLLLLTAEVLHAGFSVQAPCRPLFSVVCYLFGVAGMFLIGSPWLFRDLLEKAAGSPAWRRGSAGLAGAAAFYVVYAFLR